MTTQIISIFTSRTTRRPPVELYAPFFDNVNDVSQTHALAAFLPDELVAPFFQNVDNNVSQTHTLLTIVIEDLYAPFHQNVNTVSQAHAIEHYVEGDVPTDIHTVYAETSYTILATSGGVTAHFVYAEMTTTIGASGYGGIIQTAYAELTYQLDEVIGPAPNPADDHAEDPALITTPPASLIQMWDVSPYRVGGEVYAGTVFRQTDGYVTVLARRPVYGKRVWAYGSNRDNSYFGKVSVGAVSRAENLAIETSGVKGVVAKSDGSIWADGASIAGSGTLPAMNNDSIVYYVAFDPATKKVWFGYGNKASTGATVTWIGDPAAGTGQSWTMTAPQGDYFYPYAQVYYANHSITTSFGTQVGSPTLPDGYWAPATAPAGFSYFNPLPAYIGHPH